MCSSGQHTHKLQYASNEAGTLIGRNWIINTYFKWFLAGKLLEPNMNLVCVRQKGRCMRTKQSLLHLDLTYLEGLRD